LTLNTHNPENSSILLEQPVAAGSTSGSGYASQWLLGCWSDAPTGWLFTTESWNITSEVEKFDNLVGSLTKSSFQIVIETLESPDMQRPYSTLKQRLLDSHKLLEPELLSHMRKICSKGEERNRFFIFLQQLPKEL
jgi:hypothetical protein